MNPLRTIAILTLALPGPAPEAPPVELLPMYSVFRMANLARAVVEGVPNEDGTIAVRTRHFVREGDAIPDSLRVHDHGEFRRTSKWGREPKQAVAPDTVLLFLQEPHGNGAGRALVTTHDGARGVLWFEGTDVWGFGPGMISGELDLGRWTIQGQERAATPAAVRAEVTAGLAARARWDAALALADPERRAEALAAYLDPATSPDGDHWQERVWPDAITALGKVGAPAARPLARLIQSHADAEVVHFAAWAARTLGPEAQDAVPSLVARVRQPLGADVLGLVEALGAIGSPAAAPALRDQIGHQDPLTAAQAALALARCGGADAAALLEARIPADVDDRHPVTAVVAMLSALHDLDRAAAERLALERFSDYEEILAARDWLRALRK